MGQESLVFLSFNMHLEKLKLFHFKNYTQKQYSFGPGLHCFLGKNGSGKTNLLDAIYSLCLTKSSLGTKDEQSIQHEKEQAVLHGFFRLDEKKEHITLVLNRSEKKQVLSAGKPYAKKSEHIGRFPVVLIAPDDTDIIRDGSDTRRRLIDSIVAQFDAEYLQCLQKYTRYVDHRNKLLKQFLEKRTFDSTLLQTYDEGLVPLAQKLSKKRKAFLEEFQPNVQEYYAAISKDSERVSIVYDTQVNDSFQQLLEKNRLEDRKAGRTTSGTHKDEYHFLFNEESFKKYGSQGQKKSFIMAIRLAQFDWLHEKTGKKPILLLDDIFDKLDENRIEMLVTLIKSAHFGQVFLTDARPERTKAFLQDVEATYWDIPG